MGWEQNEKDLLVWTQCPSGTFSASNAYSLLKRGFGVVETLHIVYHELWGFQVTSNVAFLMLRIMHDSFVY